MSARSVCSGMRPSEYVSERDISAPPSRPPQVIFTPCAPERIGEASEGFIARRARGVDVDRDALLVLLDQDVGQTRVPELAVGVLADLDVLDQVLGEVLRARVPVGLPLVDDADPQAARMNLLPP